MVGEIKEEIKEEAKEEIKEEKKVEISEEEKGKEKVISLEDLRNVGHWGIDSDEGVCEYFF